MEKHPMTNLGLYGVPLDLLSFFFYDLFITLFSMHLMLFFGKSLTHFPFLSVFSFVLHFLVLNGMTQNDITFIAL